MTTQQQANERLASLEEKTTNIATDLTELKKDFKDFIQAADQRYAPAWAGKAIIWLIAAVMGILVTAAVTGLIAFSVSQLQSQPAKTEVQVTTPVK